MNSIGRYLTILTLACVSIGSLIGCGGSTEKPITEEPVPSPAGTRTPVVAEALPTTVLVDGDPSALLTQVDGDVIVLYLTGEEGNGANSPVEYHAGPLMTLKPGAVLLIPEGDSIGLICSGDRWLSLQGDQEWQLTEASCSEGRALTPGIYQRMLPDFGRIPGVDSSQVIEMETREDTVDYGRKPIILEPRMTSLIDLEPQLRWIEVPGAVDYMLTLYRDDTIKFPEIAVKTEDVSCQNDSESPYELPYKVCTMPWPAEEWQLSPGKDYYLVVGSRMSIVEQPRESEQSTIHTLPEAEALSVRGAVTEIENLGIDPVTSGLLLATLYAEHGMIGDAIAIYQAILKENQVAELYVTLGDLYSHTGLPRRAFKAYDSALQTQNNGGQDTAVQAASEFGIGRLYYNNQNFHEARDHFKVARDLFEQLDAGEEKEAAQLGLESASNRLIATPDQTGD